MTMADMAELADASPGSYRLENADSNWPPPAAAIKATKDAVGLDRYNSYLPLHGLPELRKAIADRYQADLGLRYDPDGEVLVTAATGEAMLDVLLSYINEGDRVLMTNPTYNGMAQRVRLAGGVQVFTNQVEAQGWHLDIADFRKAARGCRVIFYGSPSMPTGVVFDTKETKLIVEVAIENDALVIFNGAVDKLVFDGKQVANPATLPGMRDRTIICGSVTKNYNMIGWRIGWAVGPRELLKPVHDVHIFNGIMASGFAEAGATAALTGDQRYLDETVKAFQRRRDVLAAELNKIPGIRFVLPDGGYFFIANISAFGVPAGEFCRNLLEEEDVAITPMNAWGADDFGDHHVRFIFTNESENRLVQAANRIGAFVKRHSLARSPA
ncbi:MAG: pyridoxal phosphate-dependent aminotransferase [Chloroflexi bacterium]|nr:MAG: pyridoxal phosphate-dependent aminotransferase [Chloroflexota bacterium]